MIGDDYQMLYDLERRAHRITRQNLELVFDDPFKRVQEK